MVLFEQELGNYIDLKALQAVSETEATQNVANEISSDIMFYNGACNNEFSAIQIESLLSILSRMELPEHEMGIAFAKYHYLEEQYSRFNAYSEQHAILNRYSYFYTMLVSERDKQAGISEK